MTVEKSLLSNLVDQDSLWWILYPLAFGGISVNRLSIIAISICRFNIGESWCTLDSLVCSHICIDFDGFWLFQIRRSRSRLKLILGNSSLG